MLGIYKLSYQRVSSWGNVLCIISGKSDVMASLFFEQGFMINASFDLHVMFKQLNYYIEGIA